MTLILVLYFVLLRSTLTAPAESVYTGTLNLNAIPYLQIFFILQDEEDVYFSLLLGNTLDVTVPKPPENALCDDSKQYKVYSHLIRHAPDKQVLDEVNYFYLFTEDVIHFPQSPFGKRSKPKFLQVSQRLQVTIFMCIMLFTIQ